MEAPVGANLFAKGPVHPPKMRRLAHRLREQVRSHGLRPEACKLNCPDCVSRRALQRGNAKHRHDNDITITLIS
ncbi:hypothetical protein FOM00_17755 [Pseudomonas sp. ST1]|nr:hypothetical protein DXU85_15885 [Pseudomonas savastanoi]TSC35784.1 hypothetical protein FOM00_17755 [Pseudomonas sp. ST1]